jgi:hypothetical protein
MEQTIEFAGKEARPVTTADESIPAKWGRPSNSRVKKRDR